MTYEEKKIVKKIQIALRRVVSGKISTDHPIYNYLGCTRDEFIHHIDSKFLPGMTWDNISKIWELAHVVPVTCFNLNSEEDLKLCWYYKNIIPMFSEDNKNMGSCILFAKEYYSNHSDPRYTDIINVFSKSVYKYISK